MYYLYYLWIMYKHTPHILSIHVVAMSVLFATFMSMTPEIFMSQT